MSDRIPFRDPTPDEAQVVSKRATKEIVFKVLSSLVLFVLMCPIGFIAAYDHFYTGKWGWGIAAFLFFGGIAALLVWNVVSDARFYIRVKNLDYQVVVGACGKKSITGYRHKEYHLQVFLEDGPPCYVDTSASTYKKAERGSRILVSNHKKSVISNKGLWGHLIP